MTEKEKFIKHLNESKKIVNSWPEWKQSVMRAASPVGIPISWRTEMLDMTLSSDFYKPHSKDEDSFLFQLPESWMKQKLEEDRCSCEIAGDNITDVN